MESRYNDVIGERVEVLELYRDLERMKQMEIVVQKALGMDLGESDSSKAGLSEMMNDYPIKLSYLNNVPSLLPVDGVLTQDMVVSNEEAIREHFGVDIKTEASVMNVIIKNNKAVGVALENGDEYHSDIVISGLDPKQSFLNLVNENERNNFDENLDV